mmetsp:Transcript_353/g.460  ORF Transcript_353/g.460 Transcript_353/m.460 type:complete len:223 (+) Transcript_353:245-913(+)
MNFRLFPTRNKPNYFGIVATLCNIGKKNLLYLPFVPWTELRRERVVNGSPPVILSCHPRKQVFVRPEFNWDYFVILRRCHSFVPLVSNVPWICCIRDAPFRRKRHIDLDWSLAWTNILATPLGNWRRNWHRVCRKWHCEWAKRPCISRPLPQPSRMPIELQLLPCWTIYTTHMMLVTALTRFCKRKPPSGSTTSYTSLRIPNVPFFSHAKQVKCFFIFGYNW